MNIKKLIAAVEEDICLEHFYYDQYGYGGVRSKSSCPYCQLSAAQEEIEQTFRFADRLFKTLLKKYVPDNIIEFRSDDDTVLRIMQIDNLCTKWDEWQEANRKQFLLLVEAEKERDELRQELETTRKHWASDTRDLDDIDELKAEIAELRTRYLGIDKTCELVELARRETAGECINIMMNQYIKGLDPPGAHALKRAVADAIREKYHL